MTQPAVVDPGPPRSISPPGGLKVVTAGGHRLTIPAVLVTAIVGAVASIAAATVSVLRSPPAPQEDPGITVIGTQLTKLEERLAKLEAGQAELRETQARLAGWLEGALPKVGIAVRAAPGAEQVEVETLPEPLRPPRKQVQITTPVPAPAPR